MTDLLGGVFDVMCDQTTGTTAQIKDGKIKGYAATTKERLKVLPDLPTLREVGLKDFEVTAWHAMWAPKGLPPEAQVLGYVYLGYPDPNGPPLRDKPRRPHTDFVQWME